METETTIAKAIHNTDKMARYDEACKELLSEKIILAWIMKSCVDEFRDIDVDKIAATCIEGTPQVSEVPVAPDEATPSQILGASTEDSTIREGTITYDIRFHAIVPKSGDVIRLILNLEAQNDFYPGYPLTKRGIYYCSRMISSQYGSVFAESHYEDIRKVVSIWVCTNPPVRRQNTITRYHIQEDDFIGNVKEKPANYDLMTLIMICLGDASNDYHSDILKLLGILMSDKMTSDTKCRVLQEDFDIPMTQNLERKVGLMCNLSEGVFAKGVEYERENSARKEKEWQAEREALTAENSNLSAENLRLQKQLEDMQRKLQQA